MQKLMPIRKPVLILLTSTLAFFCLATPARNEAVAVVTPGNTDNIATAVNTEDGSSLYVPAFSVVSAGGDAVDHTNAAIAFSSCSSCRTVAAAMQVVLVTNPHPQTVTPSNLAVAVNERCTDCETLAFAYQVVRGVEGPTSFSEDGNRDMAEIQEDLRDFGEDTEGRTPEETRERFSKLTAELDEAVDEELDPEDNSGRSQDNTDGSGENALDVPEPTAFEATSAGETLSPTTGPPSGGSATQTTESATTEEPAPDQGMSERPLPELASDRPAPAEMLPTGPASESTPAQYQYASEGSI